MSHLKLVIMKTKVCTDCKIEKPVSEFFKNVANMDRLNYFCRLCSSVKFEAYYHSKNGLIRIIYSAQVRSSKKRNHQPPNYTLEELRKWALRQTIFHEIFDKWVKSDFSRLLTPSFDRLDNDKSYTFDNIEVVRWEENYMRGHRDMRNGKIRHGQRAVIGVHIDTGKVVEFTSMMNAERGIKVDHGHISECCSGKRKSAGGYIWKFVD